METVQNLLLSLKDILDIPILNLGKSQLTSWSILLFLALLLILFFTTARLKNWIVNRVLVKSSVDIGVRHAIATIFRYVILTVGFVIILQTAGIDLSALTILIGSFSIGVGLGLQNITNNFVSGLVILLERPIKIGDRIEVGKLNGDVLKIAARATTILTNDNIAIIVPNADLISSSVINWSYPTRRVRFNIRIGVAYGSDPESVKDLLLQVAYSHSGVLKEPVADVLFDEFGESALQFQLRVWTTTFTSKPGVLKSELNYAIYKKFKEVGIEIHFPQRDIHIRNES